MAAQVALIIPALNEELAIAATLEGLRGAPVSQVIVVDNGSTDHTADAARQHGAQLVAEPRRGYGQACLAGMAALAPAAEIVCFMDGDGSDDPADLPRLLLPIERYGADLVIGSRTLGAAEPGSLTPQQRFGNWLVSGMLRLLYGLPCTDLGPFRAIRRDALDRLQMRDTNFGWTIEMQIKAARLRMRVVEIPVHYRKRHSGQSKISGTLKGTILAGIKIIWTMFRYTLAR